MGKSTILVIEDTEALLNLYTQLLEHNNYNVLSSPNGEGGLKLYKSNSDIAVVILHMILPDLHGMDVLKQIQDINPDQHVILCSGSHIELSKKFYGNVSTIQKPFIMESVLDIIKDAINSTT